jgi:hypothetical protein
LARVAGATPIATQNGQVIYISNNNQNINGDNNNNDGTINQNSGSDLSGGVIAGITVACAIVGTVLAALGVWYARRSVRLAEKKKSAKRVIPGQALEKAEGENDNQVPNPIYNPNPGGYVYSYPPPNPHGESNWPFTQNTYPGGVELEGESSSRRY